MKIMIKKLGMLAVLACVLSTAGLYAAHEFGDQEEIAEAENRAEIQRELNIRDACMKWEAENKNLTEIRNRFLEISSDLSKATENRSEALYVACAIQNTLNEEKTVIQNLIVKFLEGESLDSCKRRGLSLLSFIYLFC